MGWLVFWGGLLGGGLLVLSVAAVALGGFTAGDRAREVREELRRDSLVEAREVLVRRTRLAELLSALTGHRVSPGQEGVLASEIDRNARLYDFDPLLILAVVLVESGGDPSLLGQNLSGNLSGAVGIMQLKPATARAMAHEMGEPPPTRAQLLDPSWNLRLGVAFLLKMVHRYRDLRLGIMAYNVGPGALESGLRGNGRPLPEGYFRRVLAMYRRLEAVSRRL